MATDSTHLGDTSYWNSRESKKWFGRRFPAARISSQLAENQQGSMSANQDESRLMLWIDAVGGYLVCPRREIIVGQAVEQSRVDVPILGDLARRHLKIKRSADGYLLEPFGYVKLNGREYWPGDADAEHDLRETQGLEERDPGHAVVAQQKILLKHGDLLELTGGIRIRFSKPHPLSASARLDFESRHRTQPWSDGVLLMAESCVLGPGQRNHVVCRGWRDDLVLFRQPGGLYCKSLQPIRIDGESVQGKHSLTRNSHIEGEDFSMTLEPLSS